MKRTITINNKRYTWKAEKCLPLQFLKLITAGVISILAVLPFVMFLLGE